MNNKEYTQEQIYLAKLGKALANPARIAILEFLANRETCFFGDIHEELPIAKSTVSQHLNELKEVGLIQGDIESPKVRYCIKRDNWQIAKKLLSNFFEINDSKKCKCK
ncbi:MAG: winged helix-turn-helix transcriptional regulator [Bacteroidetes bacterium]|nr:winged helix-turn-helix transcriptional regulator [Bacteroidota bacterium]